MLSEHTVKTIDYYWSSYLGCPLDVLASDHTLVVPHATLGDYQGLFMLLHRNALVISVPPSMLESVRLNAELWTSRAILNDARLRALVGDRVDRIIGPAFIGYADGTSFRPMPNMQSRMLDEHDAPALQRLRRACSAQDWEYGGSDLGEQPLVGRFFGDELVAVAGYEVWGSHIAHIAVVTHPAYRAKGYGRDVVTAIAEIALRRGLIPQYRTLQSNQPSRAIASALGFEQYAVSIAVRLK